MAIDNEMLRYARQIILPQFGVAAQHKLTQAKILIMGIGGLGSPAALYLASSGVGEITLADFDVVEISNLSRQILHSTNDIGNKKTISAEQTLSAINPNIKINKIDHVLTLDELITTVETVDIVLDCTDNFESRYEINTACACTKTKLVTAAAAQFSGQLASFDFANSNSACYQCLYPNTKADETQGCAENGILSPIVGTIGVLQALETIKIITGVGNNLFNKLLLFDGLNITFKNLTIANNPSCPICS